jgi:hypothetical protein
MGFPSLQFQLSKSRRSRSRQTRRRATFWLTEALAQGFAAVTVLLMSVKPQRSVSRWQTLGVMIGVLIFVSILATAETASAQLFNSAEKQATSVFGQYIDNGIITFLFGMLRIVVWVSAVGFILFAVYQAQRGEQWQPLMQNAFITVAAVVAVEGLSALFFGGGTTTTTSTPQ